MDQRRRMPAVFIGHGSPMNALENNRYTSAWQELGRMLPRPRAILSISAHWYIHGTAVTAMQSPRVIHDFYGFPQALFDFDYPAAGAPQVAQEIADIIRPDFVGLDHDSWGIDHGTWSILAHLFPKADIPVLQLSVHAGKDIDYHIELGRRLAPLREAGVLILGSGNVVHNLRRLDWSLKDDAFDWGNDFDKHVKKIMTTQPAELRNVVNHPVYSMAVPTQDHFLPLAYLAGLSEAARLPAEVLVEGGTMGALTMTSYVLGCEVPPRPVSNKTAPSIPNPGEVPPDQTNM